MKAGRGGHVILFQSTLPTVGAGALPMAPPSETALYDTDKEKNLHAPRSGTWISIAEECAEHGIGVSMFLAPGKYMDTGSVCVVATRTGGEVFWHPRFVPARDGPIVRDQLRRLVTRGQGYNCMARVRTSHGMSISLPHLTHVLFSLLSTNNIAYNFSMNRPAGQSTVWDFLCFSTERTCLRQLVCRRLVLRRAGTYT